MSTHVVSQDHYMIVESQPGIHELTEERVGTRFAIVTIRTFADVANPADIAVAHPAQDAIEINGGGSGPFVASDWDTEDLAIARQALGYIAVPGFVSTADIRLGLRPMVANASRQSTSSSANYRIRRNWQ